MTPPMAQRSSKIELPSSLPARGLGEDDRKSLHNHVLYKLKQKFQNEYSEDPYKTINFALVICWATRA